MAQDNSNLPEGTDKVIAGASTTAMGADGTRGEKDPLFTSGDATAPDTLGGIGRNSPATGDDAGEDLLVVETTTTTVATTADSGGSSGVSGESIKARLRSGSDKLSGQAADKARGFVGQGLGRSSEALANVSRLVGETAPGLEERLGPEFGDYARRAATAIEDAANSLASKDADELIDDTRDFVRRSPTVALAGAAIVGFALARLVKAGLAGSGNDGDGDGKSSRRTGA
ncbi:MAG: hypothetical protein M3Q52_11845 [Pseudomonadota bacterium]|nr:hypothetical protein [Pseudomonadota bacterium]